MMFDSTVLLSPDEGDGGGAELAQEQPAGGEDIAAPEPTGPLSLADDAQVSWEGLDAPLTGKEIREGYLRQSDYTRKTQEIANQIQAAQRAQQERDRAMQYARQLEARLQQPKQPAKDPTQQYWERMEQQGGIPTAQELRPLLEHLQENGIGGLRQALQQRDSQLQYILQDYMGTKQQVSALLNQQTEASRNRAISDALSSAGVADDTETRTFAEEMARDMYFSFEPDFQKGETWDTYNTAFPDMFKDRWSKWKRITRSLDKQELAEAKRQSLPRRGGSASPSKPMKPKDETPSEIAEMFAPEGGWRD